MDYSTAFAEETVENAISHTHQGGNWHCGLIGSASNAILDSETQYLFHLGDHTDIIALEQPPGAVQEALESYQENLEMVYLSIDTDKTNTLHVIREALSSRAFLAELRSCFEGIGTIRISDALAGTLTSSNHGRARQLTKDIKANAMLVMISDLTRLRPDRINRLVQDILLPVVHGVYEHLRVTHNLDRTTAPPLFNVPPGHRLSAHIPAESQLDVPDGVSFTSIPSHLSANPWDNPVVGIPVGTSLGPVPRTSSKRKHASGRLVDKLSGIKSKKGRSGKFNGQSRAKKENAIPASMPSGPSTSNATRSLAGIALAPPEPPSQAGPSQTRKPGKAKRKSLAKLGAMGEQPESSSPSPSTSLPAGSSKHRTLRALAGIRQATGSTAGNQTAVLEPRVEQLQRRNPGKAKRKHVAKEKDIA